MCILTKLYVAYCIIQDGVVQILRRVIQGQQRHRITYCNRIATGLTNLGQKPLHDSQVTLYEGQAVLSVCKHVLLYYVS